MSSAVFTNRGTNARGAATLRAHLPDLFAEFISHRNDKNEDGTKRFSKAERAVIDSVEADS